MFKKGGKAMLIFPKQGMWHHIRVNASVKKVYEAIKGKEVKIACFCGEDDPQTFDTRKDGDLSTFHAYMQNHCGAGNLRVRIWTV